MRVRCWYPYQDRGRLSAMSRPPIRSTTSCGTLRTCSAYHSIPPAFPSGTAGSSHFSYGRARSVELSVSSRIVRACPRGCGGCLSSQKQCPKRKGPKDLTARPDSLNDWATLRSVTVCRSESSCLFWATYQSRSGVLPRDAHATAEQIC